MQQQDRKHDADSGSDGTSDELLQKENLIDSGNEHHYEDDYKTNDNARSENKDRLSRQDADSGGDASNSIGIEPGESDSETDDATGEDG